MKFISTRQILKKYNGDFNNPKCKEELRNTEEQNERYILGLLTMDKDVQNALGKYAYQTERDTPHGKEPCFEIDYDKFLDSKEHKELLEKYPEEEVSKCILNSEPIVCGMKLCMSKAKRSTWNSKGQTVFYSDDT